MLIIIWLPDEIMLEQEGVPGRDMTSTPTMRIGDKPTLHEILVAEKLDFEAKVQRAAKRKKWLKGTLKNYYYYSTGTVLHVYYILYYYYFAILIVYIAVYYLAQKNAAFAQVREQDLLDKKDMI